MEWRRKELTEYEQQIHDAAQRLVQGERGCLRLAYEGIACDNKELVQTAGHAVASYVNTLNIRGIIRLGEQFREFTSLTWMINWKNLEIKKRKNWFSSEDEYKTVLKIGSFHPDGYFREKCMEQLALYPDTLIYILLRTNDWVKEIRQKAYCLAVKQIETCAAMELVSAVQAMGKLRQSGRISRKNFDNLDKLFYERLENCIKNFPLYQIHTYEFDSRKYIYRILVDRQALSMEQQNRLLEWEKHSFCKQILITGILKNYECTDEQLEKYLMDKNSVVRRKAMEYRYAKVKDVWPGVEHMLLDGNRGVRELAVFILQKHTDMDVLHYYKKHLSDINPVPSITGLGEHGSKEEAKLLLPYLKSGIKKQIRAALEALGKLMGTDGDDLFLEYMKAPDNGISKSAYCAVKSAGISYDAEVIYDLCIQTEYEHVRRYGVRMLLQKNSWVRLPYLLKIYKEPGFEAYEQPVCAGIWTRDMYGRVTKEDAGLIVELLKKKEFPEKMIKGILFDLKFVTVQS